MVENSNAATKRAITIKMLDDFKASIDDLKGLAKDLKDQGRFHEAAIGFVFSGCMLGVQAIATVTKAYVAYPNEILPPEINTIDIVWNQISTCSAMQKEYSLHSEQGITVDYEQILHDLETLKNLAKAEQPDPAAISDATVELIQETLRADIQLIDDLFPELKNYVPEEEAKSESINEK